MRAAQRYTVTIVNVGTSYVSGNLILPYVPPAEGYVLQIKVEVLAGPAVAGRIKLLENGTDKLMEYDDPVFPGTPIAAPFSFADGPVWYEKGPSNNFVVQLASDDGLATSTLRATVTIVPADDE